MTLTYDLWPNTLYGAIFVSDSYKSVRANYTELLKAHPTRSLVEMVPRQPDVEDEDSDTTEQRAALEKESDARQHYELRVDNFGEQSQQKGGKKLERYSW